MERLINKITHGDCLEVMKEIKDKSIDMILCDLPYGTTRNKWDSIIDLDLLWEQYERVIKDNGVIALFGQSPFDKFLGASNLKLLRYEWIWEKSKSTGYLNARRAPLKSHENILIFYKKLPVYNPIMTEGKPYKNNHKKGDTGSNYGENKKDYSYDNKGTRFPRTNLKFDSVKSNMQMHPTEKPVDLLGYLIKTYTNENDLILDNCIGSGSTAIAAINTNRNFIGIEKELEYVNVSNKRIEDLYETKTLQTRI